MVSIYKNNDIGILKKYIGEDLYIRQYSKRHVCFPIGTDAYFFAFNWCDINDVDKGNERFCIYCGKEDFIIWANNKLCEEIISNIKEQTEPFQILTNFISDLISDDVDVLERVENSINELELSLLSNNKNAKYVGSRIITLRRSLLRIKRYYEQLGIIFDKLVENENDAIPENLINRFTALNRSIHYLIQSVVELREYVTQVREAYQAEVDIEQNQIMKVLTVMTAIFLPLTLVAGWYGMNFEIPELGWHYGYPYVIGLSILVCAVCYFVFKKKKWF